MSVGAKASQDRDQESVVPGPSIQPRSQGKETTKESGKKTHVKVKRQELEFTIRELEGAKAKNPESWGSLELDGVLFWLESAYAPIFGGQILP